MPPPPLPIAGDPCSSVVVGGKDGGRKGEEELMPRDRHKQGRGRMEQGCRARPRAAEEKLTSRHHRCRAVNFLPSLADCGGLEELQAGG